MQKDKKKFEEIADGYGFSEVERFEPETYCSGCLVAHNRRTKMYSNGTKAPGGIPETLCRYQVIRLYGEN